MLGSELLARHERWHTPEISDAVVAARCDQAAADSAAAVAQWDYDAAAQPSGPLEVEYRPAETIPTRARAVLHIGDCDLFPFPADGNTDEDSDESDSGDDSESRSRSRSAEPVQRSMGRELSEPPPPVRADGHGGSRSHRGSTVSGRDDRDRYDKLRHVSGSEGQGHGKLRHVPRGEQAGGDGSGGESAPSAATGSGERLDPPHEVRVRWVPKPFKLIRKALRPAVHAVGANVSDAAVERISPEGAREHDTGSSTAFNGENDVGDLAEGVFATADSVAPDAEI